MGDLRGVPLRRVAGACPQGRDAEPAVSDRQRPLRWTPAVVVAVAVAVALLIGFGVTVVVAGPAAPAASFASYLAQIAAAGLATVACAVLAARKTWPQIRRPALLLGIGCGLWSSGEVAWFVSEWVVRSPLPDVSFVDALFLAFPLFMAAAAWVPLQRTRLRRLRVALDGVIIAASLFVLSWVFALTYMAEAASPLSQGSLLVVSLLYPCLDIVALTILMLGLSQLPLNRPMTTTLTVAMTIIAVGDMLYAYETVVGTFATGTAVDLTWITGFGMIAVLATMAWTADVRAAPRVRRPAPGTGEGRVLGMVPYLPVGAALAVLAVRNVIGSSDPVSELVTIAVLGLVLLRQYLTLRDNRALTRDLASREAELRRQAFQDVLTGLPNRALFTQRVAEAVERHRRERRPLALLFIDLDDFKAVNDTLGHPVGDELVTQVGARLRRLVRSTDVVSRFGGDEFAVLVEGDHDPVAMADRLVAELRQPFALRVKSLAISCSIGIAHIPADAETPGVDEIFSRADIAMYAAKRAGKGQRSSHHPDMVLPEARDLHFRPLLIDAVSAGRIDCVFQPIVALDDRRLVSLEALARWYIDDRAVDQGYFIDLAGRSGLLPALTDHMLDRACAHLASWTARFGCDDLKISVNVPPGLMTDPAFPARVVTILERHEVRPRQLALEITEDALLGDYRTTQVVAQELRDLGIEVWLDDFGSGYSSLLSLRRICLQSVKIDLEFVANIHRDAEAEQFLTAMLRLTRELGLVVTAEGVELQEQADILSALGCTYAQGFLYSEPVTSLAVEAMLARGDFDHSMPLARRSPAKTVPAPLTALPAASDLAELVGGLTVDPIPAVGRGEILLSPAGEARRGSG